MSRALNLGQSWRTARDKLAAAGIEGAALDARLLAEKAFGLTRLDLATNENTLADGKGLAALDALIDRRLAGEPVARILGEKEFYGLSFVLNEATLVPRPETELLVDKALAVLEGRAEARVLDLGTGTGCLPIAVLANAPGVTAVATDLSEQALAAARENAQRHAVAGRMVFCQGSWFEALAAPSSVSASTLVRPEPVLGREATLGGTFSHEGRRSGAPFQASDRSGVSAPKAPAGRPPFSAAWEKVDRAEGARRMRAAELQFDLIVSNPPYIESDAIAGLAREVREHDPHLALDGGPDGLDPYRVIASQAPHYLKPGGWLMVEIGSDQGEAVAELLKAAGFLEVSTDKDLAGLDRVVSGHHV